MTRRKWKKVSPKKKVGWKDRIKQIFGLVGAGVAGVAGANMPPISYPESYHEFNHEVVIAPETEQNELTDWTSSYFDSL